MGRSCRMYRQGRNTEEGTENRSVLCVRTLRVPSHKHKCFHSGRVAALLRTQVFQTMEERRMKSEEDARASCGSEPSGSLLARVFNDRFLIRFDRFLIVIRKCLSQHLLRWWPSWALNVAGVDDRSRHVAGSCRLAAGVEVLYGWLVPGCRDLGEARAAGCVLRTSPRSGSFFTDPLKIAASVLWARSTRFSRDATGVCLARLRQLLTR